MTKASDAIKAVFQFIPEVMQYQEILKELLIKYSTEACEEQKQVCADYAQYEGSIWECSIDKDSIINSPLPDFT